MRGGPWDAVDIVGTIGLLCGVYREHPLSGQAESRVLVMFHFTIRDLLWLIVVAAMGLGWWLDRDAVMRSAWRDSNSFYHSQIAHEKTRRALDDAERQSLRFEQDRERLKEEVREKQLLIEQLLAAPSRPTIK
jgi:hypothetical protein